jgi:hypothetical protein
MTSKEPTPAEERQGYRERLQAKSNQELIKTFNAQKNIHAFNRHRLMYLEQLQAEMRSRDWDISEVNDFGEIKYKKRIKLVGKKVVFEQKLG